MTTYTVTGNTYSVRTELKSFGFAWDKESKSWTGNEEAKAELDRHCNPSMGRALARQLNALTVEEA